MPGMDGRALLEWIRAEGLRTRVVMISALGDVNDAVKALKSGASDYLIKPFDPTELILKVRAVVGSRKQEDLIEAGARTADGAVRLLGESAATHALRLLIDKVATGTTTVLITGESGTGKEVVAREIHARSPNAAEPFVAVNIGGIHDSSWRASCSDTRRARSRARIRERRVYSSSPRRAPCFSTRSPRCPFRSR